MAPHALLFRVHPGRYSVCRLDPDAALPDWATGALLSFTRTPKELSVVCREECVPEDIKAERGWAALELAGPFTFGLTGILASFLTPLAEAQVPILALSTYGTDWILVPEAKLEAAVDALAARGHTLEE